MALSAIIFVILSVLSVAPCPRCFPFFPVSLGFPVFLSPILFFFMLCGTFGHHKERNPVARRDSWLMEKPGCGPMAGLRKHLGDRGRRARTITGDLARCRVPVYDASNHEAARAKTDLSAAFGVWKVAACLAQVPSHLGHGHRNKRIGARRGKKGAEENLGLDPARLRVDRRSEGAVAEAVRGGIDGSTRIRRIIREGTQITHPAPAAPAARLVE